MGHGLVAAKGFKGKVKVKLLKTRCVRLKGGSE